MGPRASSGNENLRKNKFIIKNLFVIILKNVKNAELLEYMIKFQNTLENWSTNEVYRTLPEAYMTCVMYL